LPGLPYTTRQLLQHRAGVGNYGSLPAYQEAVAAGEMPWTRDEVLARIPPEQLLFAPATGWSYSNVGYLLVRRQVETACGAGLAVVLRELILEPLGLRRSKLAETADEMRQTTFAPLHHYHPGWVYHGCVVGPVCEAALALHRLLTGRLLTPESREAMLNTFPLAERPAGRPWQTTGYGLGLMMGTMQLPGMRQPVEVAGHSGGGPGSVGAVYCRRHGASHRTAAAFTSGTDVGVAEAAALRLLYSHQPDGIHPHGSL
jgi:CubicO group peptidase (beta-lactamase class C family)